MNRFHLVSAALVLAACSTTGDTTSPTVSFANNPCLPNATLTLAEAQSARIDCSNGGTTLTLAGGGASYLIVPEFATDQAANQYVLYSVASGSVAAAATSANRASARRLMAGAAMRSLALPPRKGPGLAQIAADRWLRARARQRVMSPGFRTSLLRASGPQRSGPAAAPPALGSIRSFHVLSSFTVAQWKSVGAQLAYVGNNILMYIDTLAPTNGFSPTQLQNFGNDFDQTFYPIDTTAFGSPSDLDGNGRVIVLMSPVVNADTPAATCSNSGYVAGFFDQDDFDGPSDPNSNQGEIFYSIVPDSGAVFSCAHGVGELEGVEPGTFLHELQHLINFSQHVVVSGGNPGASWLDEGLSIVAEELGSLYYEQKCPPPSCRTDPTQIFPDSSQGLISDALYDSYQFALLPDTASLTLHDDGEQGFSWRGGDWLLMRWLGDQMGSGFYKKLERGPSDGVADIEQASGQTFPVLFANFGLSLFVDSLPGMPRATAPAANRFTSRNVRQLWARLFQTSGGSANFPLLEPVQLFAITADTSSNVLDPGTMTYFRLDTPAGAATVTIRFAGPAGAAFSSTLKPQMAVFRLPAGQ